MIFSAVLVTVSSVKIPRFKEPKTTLRSKAFRRRVPSNKQCAAVVTVFLEIRTPPQVCPEIRDNEKGRIACTQLSFTLTKPHLISNCHSDGRLIRNESGRSDPINNTTLDVITYPWRLLYYYYI